MTSPIQQENLVSKVNSLTFHTCANSLSKPQNKSFNNEKGYTLNPKTIIDELVKIFKFNLRKSHYKIKRDALEVLQARIEQAVRHKDKHFGNARYCRNIFEKIIQNQANRLAKMDTIDNEQLVIITKEDINI